VGIRSKGEEEIVMGHEDLTKQYSFLFEKRGMKKVFPFALDVYRSGKLREIVSFTVWEAFHRLGLFPKDKYLKFNNSEALKLDYEQLDHVDFRDKVRSFFGRSGLRVVQTEHNWKLLFINENHEMFGCLYPDDRDLYRSIDNGKSVVFVKRFSERIKSLFISSQNTIFVCLKGTVHRSTDGGETFHKVLHLDTSESFFRYNNAMTETPDKTLIIGEYGNVWEKGGWRRIPYLYFSSDNGETWKRSDFLIGQGTNKHVHVVKYSRLLNKILVADGDNKKRLWISDSIDSFAVENPKWTCVNKFHIQMGGYTSVVEQDGKILFGTDYQGGTNFIVETVDGKKFTKKVVPDPYRRSPIDNMVQRKSKRGFEIWANLPYSTASTRCLLMYTMDNGKSWNKVIEYNRANHAVWLISSSNEMTDELYFSIEDLKNNSRVVYKIGDGNG
jgi:hypothetical protein